MEIVIRRKAMRTLESIADYVEELNTSGAGDRWLDNFLPAFPLSFIRILNIHPAGIKGFHQKDIAAFTTKVGLSHSN